MVIVALKKVVERMGFSLDTYSEQETAQLGHYFGKILSRGDVVLINGELGTGKTALIRGITAGAGGDAAIVRSPSYTYLNIYQAERFMIYHLDVYLLECYDDLLELGIEEFWDQGLMLIEWGGRFADNLPLDYWQINLEYLTEANARHIDIIPPPNRMVALEELKNAWQS